MVAQLDTSAWAKDTTTYTEKALKELDEHYNPLLLKNNCAMENILVMSSARRS